MDTLLNDIRHGSRILAKNPGFTAVAVLTLALGIGANTSIFSVVYGVLLRPLPYQDPERLVYFWDKQPDLDRAPFSAPEFLDYQSQNKTFDQMAAVRPLNFNLTDRSEPERVRGAVVSANFFSLLGVDSSLGRGFLPEDGRAGAPRVAVLSHGLWQRRFGGDPTVLGKAVTLNEERVTVVGVMPPKFKFLRDVELWLNPKRIVPEVFANFAGDHLTMRGLHYLVVIGWLKEGATLAQAQADIDGIVQQLQKQHSTDHTVGLAPLREQVTGEIRPALLSLLVAVVFVLLIACANVANLLLARSTSRQREIAIRNALGAGRGRLIRQLLTESVLLALLGGSFGLLVAYWGTDLLVAASPPGTPRVSEIRVDGAVLAFSGIVALLTGFLFGLVPAFSASKLDLSNSLKEGGSIRSAGPARNRLRSVLVVSEVALALILLSGAGLLIKSMTLLLDVNPGFNPQNQITLWVSFSSSKYGSQERITAFVAQLLSRLEALPGVRGVAVSNDLPLQGQDTTGYPSIEGRPSATSEEKILVGQHVVNPGYFRAMGIPLLRGRALETRDAFNSTPVVIINEAMAKKFWPGEDPIGKRFSLFGSRDNLPTEIVGVVGNVRHNGLSSPPSLDAYAPLAQHPWAYLSVTLRAAGDPTPLEAVVRKEVQAIDPDQPVFGVRSMEKVIAETIGDRRLTLVLTGLFAVLALILAAVGIYGVISYAVTQRRHEIGVRIALGAKERDIFRLVVGRGMVHVSAGIAIGLAGALAVTRLISSQLFSVAPTDPATYMCASILLAGVAFLACYVPARRATKVDPTVALRYE